MTTVFLCLGEEWKKDVTVLFRHVIRSKNLQSVGEVDHLGYRRRLFERVVPEGQRDPRNLSMKGISCFRGAAGDDLRFPLGCRVLNSDVKATAADRIT